MHVNAETAGTGCTATTCTTPPVASSGIDNPVDEAATGWVISIGRTAVVEAEEGTTFTVARTPSSMAVVFTPQTMHISVPLPGLHDTDFDAATAAGPAATLIVLKSEELYARVNCKLAGCSPVAGLVSVKSNPSGDPTGPDPDPRSRT